MDRPKRKANKRIWGVALISLLLAAIVFLILKNEEFIFIPMAPFFQVLFTLIGVAIGICWAIRTTNVHQLWTAGGHIIENVHFYNSTSDKRKKGAYCRIIEKWARTFREYQYTSRFLSHLTCYLILGIGISLIPLFCELVGWHWRPWWIAAFFAIYLIPMIVYTIKHMERSSSSIEPPVPEHRHKLDRICPPILNIRDLYERQVLKKLRCENELLRKFLGESHVSYDCKKGVNENLGT